MSESKLDVDGIIPALVDLVEGVRSGAVKMVQADIPPGESTKKSGEPFSFGTWYPIESAPKDGCLFLAGSPTRLFDVVKFRKHGGYFVDARGQMQMHGITHWMPLPAAPKEQP